jgi:Tol biopolymer transport system component
MSRTIQASQMMAMAALAFAVACSDSNGPPTSPGPVTEYDLVYERRTIDGGTDVRRVSLSTGASTSIPLVVTVPGAFVRDVAPSPDGTRLAFTVAWYPVGSSLMDGDIYVANVDGSALRRLTTEDDLDEQPAWSPDGTRIAFRTRRSGNTDIWVMGADGTGQVNLMADLFPAASTELTPAWSPDGSRIAYASDIDSFAHPRLWTMRADGGDKRLLLASSTAVAEPDIDREPSWSPDGSKIAFRRVGAGVAGSDIMVATVATGAVARIAMAGVQVSPAWSPDGSRIAFVSNHDGLLSHIFTMKLDGTGIERFTTDSGENTNPRWLRAVAPAARMIMR